LKHVKDTVVPIY